MSWAARKLSSGLTVPELMQKVGQFTPAALSRKALTGSHQELSPSPCSSGKAGKGSGRVACGGAGACAAAAYASSSPLVPLPERHPSASSSSPSQGSFGEGRPPHAPLRHNSSSSSNYCWSVVRRRALWTSSALRGWRGWLTTAL